MKELDLNIQYKEIESYSKSIWNSIINKRTKVVALKNLILENKTKSKTKHIIYEQLEMSDYLSENKNTKISKIIYSIRAGTLDLKYWNPWKYSDNLCVMRRLKEENMEHFMNCNSYKRTNIDWEDIFENEKEKQFEIGKEAKIRLGNREIKKEGDGQASSLAPTAPDRPDLYC